MNIKSNDQVAERQPLMDLSRQWSALIASSEWKNVVDTWNSAAAPEQNR